MAGDGCIVEASGGKASLFVLRKYSGARCSNHRNEINMVGQRNPANAKAITLRAGGLGHGKIVCLPIGLRELFFEYGNPILIEGARFIGRWVWLDSCGSPIHWAMGLVGFLWEPDSLGDGSGCIPYRAINCAPTKPVPTKPVPTKPAPTKPVPTKTGSRIIALPLRAWAGGSVRSALRRAGC